MVKACSFLGGPIWGSSNLVNAPPPLTNLRQSTIILRSTIKTMTLTSKFKKDLQTLRGAVNGDFFLDVKNPKLLKKVRRYYENNGLVFSGDPLDDYDILMEQVAIDLETVEA